MQAFDVPDVVLDGRAADAAAGEVLGAAAEDPVAEQVEPVPRDGPAAAPQHLGQVHLRAALLAVLSEGAVDRLLDILLQRRVDAARICLPERPRRRCVLEVQHREGDRSVRVVEVVAADSQATAALPGPGEEYRGQAVDLLGVYEPLAHLVQESRLAVVAVDLGAGAHAVHQVVEELVELHVAVPEAS